MLDATIKIPLRTELQLHTSFYLLTLSFFSDAKATVLRLLPLIKAYDHWYFFFFFLPLSVTLRCSYGLHPLHRHPCSPVGLQTLPGAHCLSVHLSIHQPVLDQNGGAGDGSKRHEGQPNKPAKQGKVQHAVYTF